MANLWGSGDAYERYIGRWSRVVAPRFINWLSVPAGRSWLDVGCGTGAVTQAILAAAPSRVVGLEPSEAFLGRARAGFTDPRVSFVRGVATDSAGYGVFDVVVSGLVFNFLPDPYKAMEQMKLATSPGGIVAAYVWDYAAGMQLMRYFWDAATELDPDAAQLDEGLRTSLCKPGALHDLFEAHLAGVETGSISVATTFTSLDDYWQPFLGAVGSAPAYTASLDDERREALRQRLKERLPAGPDGSIKLEAKAWTVKGRRP